MLYGADYSTWKLDPELCGNCQEHSDVLIPLGNWNFKACLECAEWCDAVEMAEPCPDLNRAVVAANSIEEVRTALRAHQAAECVHCGSTKRAVMEDSSLIGAKDAIYCEPTTRKEVL